MDRDELKNLIKDDILSDLDFLRDIDDEEMLERIDKSILRVCRRKNIPIEEKIKLRNDLFFSIRKLDVLQNLVDEPSVTDVRSLENIQCTRTTIPKKPVFWAFLICGSSQSTVVSYLTDFNSDYM